MKEIHNNIDQKLIRQLRKKYFCNPEYEIELEPGEYLMHQNRKNIKLFLVLEGKLAGYLDAGSGRKQEIFRCEKDMFVGVHSFFSQSFSAYADVIALEKSRLAYIRRDQDEDCTDQFIIEDFVPVIVHELSARQRISKDIMQEKEEALKKLYQSDKLATLGQMASGLAHELNNAIGVMKGNSEWLADEIFEYFRDTEIDQIFSNFERGFTEGQTLSSTEVRKKRKALEKKLNLASLSAKKLAKINYEPRDIKAFSKIEEADELIDRMYHFWEMGVAIHDILVASKHSVHVLQSIKQLSIADQERQMIGFNDTVDESLILLKNIIRQIELVHKPGPDIRLSANKGELVQIWVNIIKNACESMLNAEVKQPRLIIETGKKRGSAWITVTDNGPGIPEEVRQKIFQPNFTTKKGGLSFGLGLGLAIVQRLVDSYNGKIEVSSKKGKTSFTIRIPIDQEGGSGESN